MAEHVARYLDRCVGDLRVLLATSEQRTTHLVKEVSDAAHDVLHRDLGQATVGLQLPPQLLGCSRHQTAELSVVPAVALVVLVTEFGHGLMMAAIRGPAQGIGGTSATGPVAPRSTCAVKSKSRVACRLVHGTGPAETSASWRRLPK